MTYDLFIGDRFFSSWSLRGWLMLEMFNLPYRVHLTGLYSGSFARDLAPLAPAKLVPVLKTPESDVIGESLAIAETLAERHPQAGLWPADASLRARARWLCAEMVGGFSDLRRDCPMQLKEVNGGFVPSQGVLDDVARVETIWQDARRLSGSQDGWLFGAYSLADVFFAPVAARIIGYDLDVSAQTHAYCIRSLSLPSVQNWRKEGLMVSYDPYPYPRYAPFRDWPV